MNNSWEGIESIIQIPRGRMGDMMDGRGRAPTPPIMITDQHGKIVLNTLNIDIKRVSKEQLKLGVNINIENKVIGYIFSGSMLVEKLTLEEEYFLGRITNIIIIVTLFILIISIIISYLFSYKLTKPISKLSSASKQIGSGDYTTRVDVNGNDEISMLGVAFNNMAKSIEDSDSWRKQIIADSAHELRTPTTLIQGHLEMIIDGVYKPDKKHIESIYNETKVLTKLIQELQELSSAESGSMKLNIEKLDINKLIKNTSETFIAGDSQEVALKTEINKNIPLIDGDWQKLKQVVTNVLANAYRHTPIGGEIKISSHLKNREVSIIIEDNGCGIAKDELEKIFERFYRTDRSRNRNKGGSGLGLAISREIIRLHRGSIYAESEIDKGTKIVIKLPVT